MLTQARLALFEKPMPESPILRTAEQDVDTGQSHENILAAQQAANRRDVIHHVRWVALGAWRWSR